MPRRTGHVSNRHIFRRFHQSDPTMAVVSNKPTMPGSGTACAPVEPMMSEP